MAKTYNTLTTDATAGSVLTASGYNQVLTNIRNYRVPPVARVERSTTQSHNVSGTWIAVQFNATATIDTGASESPADAMHSSSSNNTRITAKTAGIYLVSACLLFASNATGLRAARLLRNGAVIANDSRGAVNGDATIISLCTVVAATAGQYFEIEGFQNSTGTINMAGDPTSMQAAWLGQVS
jgi:hypothetical protein